jgi:hypothetical protein
LLLQVNKKLQLSTVCLRGNEAIAGSLDIWLEIARKIEKGYATCAGGRYKKGMMTNMIN